MHDDLTFAFLQTSYMHGDLQSETRTPRSQRHLHVHLTDALPRRNVFTMWALLIG